MFIIEKINSVNKTFYNVCINNPVYLDIIAEFDLYVSKLVVVVYEEKHIFFNDKGKEIFCLKNGILNIERDIYHTFFTDKFILANLPIKYRVKTAMGIIRLTFKLHYPNLRIRLFQKLFSSSNT